MFRRIIKKHTTTYRNSQGVKMACVWRQIGNKAFDIVHFEV